eukprot:2719951-Prymnesium_polylepis.1
MVASCALDGPTVIVGGGVSGLGAAHTLSLLSCEVILLEAQHGLGGRTRTITHGAFAGQDEGAHWVHGGVQNLVTKPLFDALNLNMRPTHGDEIYQQGLTYAPAWLANGTQLSEDMIVSSYDSYERIRRGMAKEQDRRSRAGRPDITIGAAFDHVVGSMPHVSDTERALLNWHFTFEVEGDDGANLAGPRGLSLDDTYGDSPYTSFYTKGPDGRPTNHDYVPAGGYRTLVDAFERVLDASPKTQVRRGRRGDVVRIAAIESGGVAVTTRDGSVVNASRALVTLPLGVLQRAPPLFTPALPKQRTADIASLEMG